MDKDVVLFVSPREGMVENISPVLGSYGYDTVFARDTDEGLGLCTRYAPKLVLLDVASDGERSFQRILNAMKASRGKNVGAVMFSAAKGFECGTVAAPRFVKDPFDTEEVICAIQETSEKVDLMDERDEFLARLIEYSERLEEMVAEKTIELRAKNDRLRRLAVTDELTGCYNRRYFFERLRGDINIMFRYGYPISVMLIDIDDFKKINDCKGHLAGDAVLKEFAGLLKKTVRKGETVARYGGEEFTVILPHTREPGAVQAAEKIRQATENAVFGPDKLSLTVSIGVAEVVTAKGDPDEALSRADMALYEAKNAGKNAVASVPFLKDMDCS